AGSLSPDGKWVAYDVRHNDGSTDLHYRLASGDERLVRGGTGAQFTSDSRWLVFLVAPDTFGGAGGARGARGGRGGRGGAQGAAAVRHDKAGVVDLSSGKETLLDDI